MSSKKLTQKEIRENLVKFTIQNSDFGKEVFDRGRKQGALLFGYWLVNAPNKELHSKKWIEIKYNQYLKEIKEGVKK